MLGLALLVLGLLSGLPGKLRAGSISMELVGVSQSLGSYYVAPYKVSVGGTTYNLVCDDALDDVSVGETWSATTETFSNLTGALFSQGYLDNSATTISQTPAYQEAGWLMHQIIANIGNATVTGEYQYALWDIFDPGFSNTTGTLPNGEPAADLTSTEQSAVDNDLKAAEANYASGNYSDLVIYTPTPTGPGEPQEYFGFNTPQAAPEPASVTILAADLILFCLLALGLWRLRILTLARGSSAA